jgi:hypothetical protein
VILLELAAQGVRGVAPAGGRATLRPGYNVVAADGAALRRLLETLFHPDPRDAELLPRAAGAAAGSAVRAGLTLVGDDRVTWRLVRDYATGCQLHRFDPARRAFALVSQDLAEIARVLQETVGVPAPTRLGALLALSAAELPSRQAGSVPAAGRATPRPALAPEAARKRVVELRSELERARAAEELQARVDALQSQRFAADEALRTGARVREGLETATAARAELDDLAKVAGALGDPEARLAAYEKALAKRDEAVAKAAAEREGTGGEAPPAAPPPPWRRPEFWAGIGAGVAVGGLGLLGAIRGGGLRYAALLDIPAFGWSAWVALRWIGALESTERAGRRRRLVDEWERKGLEAFERDTADVRRALKALGLSRLGELREALGRVADADAVVAEWHRRLADWEATSEARDARAERARIDADIQALEARMAEAVGGFVRDARSVEAEIVRLEAELAAPPPRPTPAPTTAGAVEPIRGLLACAAAELGRSPAAALLGVQAKASQAVAALSSNRLMSLTADEKGNATVTAGGRVLSAVTLPPADRDLVWLALKLAFLDAALAARPGLALVDDAFASLPDGARRLAARLLKAAARPGQLLHATADAAFREAADHAA